MSKNDYLDKLRELLSYELPDRLVRNHVQYYADYFREQSAQGKSAQEVCDELGDPQLIARTIIDSEKAGADGIPNSDDDPDFSEEMFGNKGSDGEETAGNRETRSGSSGTTDPEPRRPFWITGSFGCLPVILVFLLLCLIGNVVLSVLGSVFSGGNGLTIILVILLGWNIYRYFQRRG